MAPKSQREEKQVTLGADTPYQDEQFVQALRDRAVAPSSEGMKRHQGMI